jgi:hypothetical protein
MKQCSVVKDLLEGTVTPEEVWLSSFGGGSASMVQSQEEEILEPEIVVEQVSEVDTDDIDWDELNIDDIDIALSDDDFLEENIEI